MAEYKYTVAVDDVFLHQLCDEVETSISKKTYAKYLGETVDGRVKFTNDGTTDNLVFTFTIALSGPDETSLGTAVTTHVPDVDYDTITRGSAPVVTDDETKGHTIGSKWYNGGNIFECIDITTGAAVWKNITAGGGGGDMTKAVYDIGDNGIVDNSEALEGNNSAYHLDTDNHTDGVTNKVYSAIEKTNLGNQSGTNTGDEPTFAGAGTDGVVPDPVTSSGNFLKDDGSWDMPAGGGDMLAANNLSDVVSAATSFSNIKQAATTTVTGVVELATDGESAPNVVVQGNDARLSDARTPTAHTHVASEVTDFDTEVSNNASVAANTAKVSANGSVATHSDVTAAQATAIGNLSGVNSGDEPNATLIVKGIIQLATTANATTGTDAVKAITPNTLEDKTYGTFTGTTITDNATLKTALQELETRAEAGSVADIRKVSVTGGNQISTSTYSAVFPSMTITPPAGTYRVVFSGSGFGSVSSPLVYYAIHIDSTIVADSEREYDHASGGQGDQLHQALHSKTTVTVNGSEAINLRAKTDSGGFTIKERILEIEEVNIL